LWILNLPTSRCEVKSQSFSIGYPGNLCKNTNFQNRTRKKAKKKKKKKAMKVKLRMITEEVCNMEGAFGLGSG